MKKLLLICILGILSSFVFSKPTQQVDAKKHEKICRNYMMIANEIMQQKQSGKSLLTALRVNDLVLKDTKDENMANIINLIIRDAYNQPNYSTPSIKQEQLNEFSAKYYLGCMAMYE